MIVVEAASATCGSAVIGPGDALDGEGDPSPLTVISELAQPLDTPKSRRYVSVPAIVWCSSSLSTSGTASIDRAISIGRASASEIPVGGYRQ